MWPAWPPIVPERVRERRLRGGTRLLRPHQWATGCQQFLWGCDCYLAIRASPNRIPGPRLLWEMEMKYVFGCCGKLM